MAPPPYVLHLSTLAQIGYLVPTSRMASLISPELGAQPVSDLGVSSLLVLAAHYDAGRSVPSGLMGPPYNEIAYGTPVVRNGVLGVYFFELHLDSLAPVVVGRQLYGFPKDLEDVEISDTVGALTFTTVTLDGTKPLASLHATKSGVFETPEALAAGSIDDIGFLSIPGVWLVKNGTPIFAPSSMSISVARTQLLTVGSIDLPYAVEAGLLVPSEVSTPAMAIYSSDDTLTLGVPESM